MASRFWVGGSATWDGTAGTKWSTTSGGSSGAAAPTAADDVFLDASSGAVTVTMSSTTVCRSLNHTGFTGTLVHPAATNPSIGDATAGASNIALKFVAGMTYTLGDVATSAFTFASTSATQQTIDYGGKNAGNITLAGGTTGNFAITSAITQDPLASVTQSGSNVHYSGASDTSALSHSFGLIASSGSTAKTFTFGNATITLTRSTAATHINIPSGASNTVSAASATFVGAPTSTGRITYTYTFPTGTVVGTMTLNGEGERNFATSYTVGTLTRNPTAHNYEQLNLPAGGSLTVTSALNVVAANSINRVTIWPNSTGVASTLVLTGATLNLQGVDFQDIIFNNGGSNLDLSAITGGSGDCGGNSITGGGTLTFTAPTTQTWQGTSGGTWSTSANWTSRTPLCQDNVVMNNAFIAGQTITCDRKWLCRDITFVGGSGNVAFTSGSYETYITGNISFRTSMTFVQGASTIWVFAPRSNVSVTGNGIASPSFPITVQSAGCQLTFADTWNIGGALTHRCGGIKIPAGVTTGWDSYISNANNAAAVASVSVYGKLQLRAGSGTIFSITNSIAFSSWPDVGGQVQLTSTSASTKTIATSGMTLPDFAVVPNGSGTFAFTGGGSFPRLPSPYTAGTATITLASGTTTTIRSPGQDQMVNGTNIVTIKSGTGASAATISKASGLINYDFVTLQDLTATGGAVFSAGANSTNTSGNTGWAFSAAKDWVPQSLMAA